MTCFGVEVGVFYSWGWFACVIIAIIILSQLALQGHDCISIQAVQNILFLWYSEHPAWIGKASAFAFVRVALTQIVKL